MYFEWSVLSIDDADALLLAQNEFVQEHNKMTMPHCGSVFQEWKRVLGYPEDDSMRLDFIRNMPSASTKHGDKLHCLKLSYNQDGQTAIVGFIDFEVKTQTDALSGSVREIYIRSITVSSRMRRRGCARLLYKAMLDYLGPGDLDVIRLCVVDLNQPALRFYFQLGFKITQWYFRQLGGDTPFKVAFLCMQKIQGERVDSENPEALSIELQDMPHLFKKQAIGEIVSLFEGDSSQGRQRARIEEYDETSQTFTIVHMPGRPGDTCDQRSVSNVCVNSLYSCGSLAFERSPSICMNEGLSSQKADIADFREQCAESQQLVVQGLEQHTKMLKLSCEQLKASGMLSGSKRRRAQWPTSAFLQRVVGVPTPPKECKRDQAHLPWASSLLVQTAQDEQQKRRRKCSLLDFWQGGSQQDVHLDSKKVQEPPPSPASSGGA